MDIDGEPSPKTLRLRKPSFSLDVPGHAVADRIGSDRSERRVAPGLALFDLAVVTGQEELRGFHVTVYCGIIEKCKHTFGANQFDLLDRTAEARAGRDRSLHLPNANSEPSTGHRTAQPIVQELEKLDPLLVGQRLPDRPRVRQLWEPGITFVIESETQGVSPQNGWNSRSMAVSDPR